MIEEEKEEEESSETDSETQESSAEVLSTVEREPVGNIDFDFDFEEKFFFSFRFYQSMKKREILSVRILLTKFDELRFVFQVMMKKFFRRK